MTGHFAQMRHTRFATLFVVAFVLALLGSQPAAASDNVVIFDQAPAGIDAEVWASAPVAPLADGSILGLERLNLDACSVISFDGSPGAVLVVAESSQLEVVTTEGAAIRHTSLPQGASMVVPAGMGFRLSNEFADPAFPATALVLSVTGDADQPLGRVTFQPGDPLVQWATPSGCSAASGVVTTTLFVWGAAAPGADHLWVGTATWSPGSTTDGWAILDPAATFDAVLLAGGMDNAGAGTGRAFHAGPYRSDLGPWQAMSDYAPGGSGSSHMPFANTGSSPVVALIFGTAGENPIYTRVAA